MKNYIDEKINLKPLMDAINKDTIQRTSNKTGLSMRTIAYAKEGRISYKTFLKLCKYYNIDITSGEYMPDSKNETTIMDTANKTEMKHICKTLYLSPDETDSTKHKYSFRDIETEMKQKCNAEISIATISRWVKKEGWEDLWIQGQRHGVQKALLDIAPDKDITEQAIDEVYTNTISTKVADHLKAIDDNVKGANDILNMEIDYIRTQLKNNPTKKAKMRVPAILIKFLNDIVQTGTETLTKKEAEANAPTLIQINFGGSEE